MNKLYKVVFLILFSFQCYAQHSNSLLKSLEYVNIADSLASRNSYDLAANYYSLAMSNHMELDLDTWYNTFGKFRTNRYKGDNDLELINEINGFLDNLSDDQFELRGKMLFYLGYYNSNLGFGSAAIIKYKKAIGEFHKIDSLSTQSLNFLLASYQNIAINYSRLGDQKSAIKFIQKAFALIDKENDRFKLHELYLTYSKFLFYDENYYEMKQVLNQVLKDCNSKIIKSYALDYMAEVYLLEDSLALAKLSLDASFTIDSNKQYQYYEIKGDYYRKEKNYPKAKQQYKTALQQLEGHISKRSYRKSLVEYADFLYFLGEKKEAVHYAHNALRSYYRGLDSLNYSDRSFIDEKLPDIWIIEALYIKAKYFREKYLESKDEFSINEAIFYYNLILTHFDRLKSKYYSSSSQYRMGAYSQKIYSEVISFFVDQYLENNKSENFDNALSLAQRANSYVLKNAISDRKALELAGISQDSLEEYLQLSSKVASDFTKDSLNDANLFFEFDLFKESLVSNYPLYSNFEKEEEISLVKIQSNLSYKTLLIKYYYFNGILTVFGISKNSFFAKNISFTEGMNTLINTNMEMLSQNVSNDSISNIYLTNSKKLYDLVLGGFIDSNQIKNIDHLIVIPDGPLKKVAFNALVIDKSKDWSNPDTYLLSKYSISYLYYCSQLKNSNSPNKRSNKYIGLGIEYEEDFIDEIINDYKLNYCYEIPNKEISLSSLKYADDEVITTANILGGSSIVNSEVTLPAVLSAIEKFEVVHFSVHAFVDESDYLNSFIVLNKDLSNNYHLKYSDILNLDVNSELIVLSACQTSSGKSVAGEGLMSLSRAFVQSGSKSTIGSYWNTPDYATKELMTLFYQNLKKGLTKSRALQQAQLEFLTNDRLSSPTIRSPFYWASWAVYGANDSLIFENSSMGIVSWKICLLISLIGIIGFFLLWLYLKHYSEPDIE